MSNYIKLNGSNIIGHCSVNHPGVNPDDYDVQVVEDIIVTEDGHYKYSYVDGQLVGLDQEGINSQPNVRDKKLVKLRELRKEILEWSDDNDKKHLDGDPKALGNHGQNKTYRIALRDITDSYKDGEGNGTSALDSFQIDMADFNQWPIQPS